MPREGPVLVDACVAMNVYATRRWADIFSACGLVPVIAVQAARETLWIRDEDGEREPIDLVQLQRVGEVEVWHPAGVEVEDLIASAAELGDGEAASMAIARRRGLSLATDDRRARKAARASELGDGLWSTTDLLRGWAERRRVSHDELRQALARVRTGASFHPPVDDSNHGWWTRARRSSACVAADAARPLTGSANLPEPRGR